VPYGSDRVSLTSSGCKPDDKVSLGGSTPCSPPPCGSKPDDKVSLGGSTPCSPPPCGSKPGDKVSLGGSEPTPCAPCSGSKPDDKVSLGGSTPCTPPCGTKPDDKVSLGGSGVKPCPPKEVKVTATAKWTTHLVHPKVLVTKKAESGTHVGDTIHYVITVKNMGDIAVDAAVTDAKCDGPVPATLHLGLDESKEAKCTHVVTAADGTKESYANTACATGDAGKGGLSKEACGDWDVPILDPNLTVSKVADRATATDNDTITYTILVTNTGNTSLTVTPSDVGCDTGTLPAAAFILAAKGDTKSLQCTYHVTTATPAGDYPNTACANGVDMLGKTASGCSTVVIVKVTHPTPTAPAAVSTPGGQAVLGERITPGTARLFGRTGCVSGAFNARVRGTKIARVVFVLDGKTLKSVSKPNSAGQFAVRVNPATMRIGVHRLVAKVTFQTASGTKAKTLRLSFQRCGRKLALPRFTG
jgi:hypothetical protein